MHKLALVGMPRHPALQIRDVVTVPRSQERVDDSALFIVANDEIEIAGVAGAGRPPSGGAEPSVRGTLYAAGNAKRNVYHVGDATDDAER